MEKSSLLIFSFVIFIIRCHQTNHNSEKNIPMNKVDPHSFARPAEAVVKHLDLDIAVDFTKKIISGKASCDIEVNNNASQIILDTRDLQIDKVTLNGEPTN